MNNEEMKLQAECYTWYWNRYRFTTWARMLHCNNNNSQNAIKGALNKSLGVVRGVSDLELLMNDGKTLYIELKVGRNGQSQEQIEFMEAAQERGHQYIIVKTFRDFVAIITEAIGDKGKSWNTGK